MRALILLTLVPLISYAQFDRFDSPSEYGEEGEIAEPFEGKAEIGDTEFIDDYAEEVDVEDGPRAGGRAKKDLPTRNERSRGGRSSRNSRVSGSRVKSDNSRAFDNRESKSNRNTFGARTGAKLGKTDTDKFVQLNPETGFGPEIITTFDFPDTDILELTRHMQELTGINLILDKDVKGKISITAPTAITVGDAWRAYLAALNMAGFTMVRSGSFYKIISARDVRYSPTAIYTGSYTPDTEAHIMKIIKLKNIQAKEIERNFRPYMSRYGRIIALEETNTLIVQDTGANINRVETLLNIIDIPGYEESLHIVPVKHSSAQEIAKLIDEILKDSSSRSGGAPSRAAKGPSRGSSGGGSKSNISKIIAEPRTNSIIAMCNAEGAKQLNELIQKLDTTTTSARSNRIHVHYLNYGNSEELAKTLSTLVSNATAASSNTNNRGSAAGRNFAPGTEEPAQPIFNNDVKVTADTNNNALVVTASPTDWLTLKGVISKLDIPRDQVYVEGTIMETNVTRNNSFGVDYYGKYGKGFAQSAGFGSTGGSNASLEGLLGSGGLPPTSLNGFFAGFGGPGQAVNFDLPDGSTIKVNSVNGLIKALASDSNSNVLATPQILALDNTEAEFQVGETVPVATVTQGANGQQLRGAQTQEAKLLLKIKPQINKVTRFVKLEITQTIDEFKEVTEQSDLGVPTTTRSAVTQVMVRDQDTIAMGGLLRDKTDESISKVPLLGDIPVLGWLFKSKSKTVTKVNLLMFLTPKILSPYNRVASQNSIEALDKYEAEIKNSIEKGAEVPNKAFFDKTRAKIERQVEGPLYDKTLPAIIDDNEIVPVSETAKNDDIEAFEADDINEM